MDFREYIKKIKKKYEVVQIGEDSYRVSDGNRELTITPRDRMYNVEDLFQSSIDVSIGTDDLYPPIGKDNIVVKGRTPKGSRFNVDDSSGDNPFIKKDDISPLKNKREPDSDHFKKPGGDDDNKFLY